MGISDESRLLVNEERTRSFLALDVDQGTAQLQKIVNSIDEVLQRYKQPTYYEVSGSEVGCRRDLPGVVRRELAGCV